MRDRFPGYYTPSADEFKKLWNECLFVPDANILLHLFRYGSNTTAQVLDTLQRLKPRVWIPYRVGFEFHRRWRDVDQGNRDAYDKLSRDIEAQGRKLSGLFDEYTRHQTIDAQKEKDEIEKFIKQFLARIEASKAQHPRFEDAEAVLNKLSALIGDDVGSAPSEEQFAELVKEGKRRFEASIPPGLRDAKKDGSDAYGDYFIWREALEKAKETNKPILIITDDVKDDWWLEFRGQKVGPRPELVAEMMSYAGQRFYLYTLSQFLDYATSFLNQKIDPAAIREIKLDEVQLRKAAESNWKAPDTAGPRLQLKFSLLRQRDILRGQIRSLDSEIDALNSTESEHFEPRVRALLTARSKVKAQHDRTVHNLKNLRKLERSSASSLNDPVEEWNVLRNYLRAREALKSNQFSIGKIEDGQNEDNEGEDEEE
jgi:hypothetical protein